jgi:hypothetical protein
MNINAKNNYDDDSDEAYMTPSHNYPLLQVPISEGKSRYGSPQGHVTCFPLNGHPSVPALTRSFVSYSANKDLPVNPDVDIFLFP